jgi:hypothetical protein
LRPKGFEVVEGAVNDDADVPDFLRRYNPPFPVGTSSGLAALEYLQWPKGQRPLVPLMAFIDRKGVIRAQFSGLDETFFNDQQDAHLREQAEKLLNETAAPAKGAAKSKKKSTAP